MKEDIQMKFVEIDCKMKEIYFTIKPVEVETSKEESECKFWNSLHSIAASNMINIQQIKMAS